MYPVPLGSVVLSLACKGQAVPSPSSTMVLTPELWFRKGWSHGDATVLPTTAETQAAESSNKPGELSSPHPRHQGVFQPHVRE